MSRFVPTFGPRKKVAESETLYESRACFIHRLGDAVWMNAEGKWSKSLAAAARRFGVERLLVSRACAEGGLAFLEELPGLRELSVSVPDRTLDWGPVERLAKLEHLSVSSAPIVRTQPPGEIDFAAMRGLVSCELSKYDKQWASVFRCARLRGLHLTTSDDLKGELDFSGLPKLTELVLGGLPKVTSFRLAERAKVRSMQLRSCRKLQVDWGRVGRDLQYLWVEGRTAWPLEALRHAPKLEGLMLTHRGRIASAEFLQALPRLKWVDLFLAKFDEEGKRVVRSFKGVRAMMPG